MNKVVLAKPNFGYEGHAYGQDILGKGTRVIIPEGLTFLIQQNGKNLLSGDGPKDFRISGKTVPGLQSKLFKKDLSGIRLYVFNKKRSYLAKFVEHRVNLTEGISKEVVDQFKPLSFSFFLRIDIDGVDIAKLFENRKPVDGDFWPSRAIVDTLSVDYFNLYLAYHGDYFVKNYLEEHKVHVVLEHGKDANEQTHAIEKYMADSFQEVGFNAQCTCVGVFD